MPELGALTPHRSQASPARQKYWLAGVDRRPPTSAPARTCPNLFRRARPSSPDPRAPRLSSGPLHEMVARPAGGRSARRAPPKDDATVRPARGSSPPRRASFCSPATHPDVVLSRQGARSPHRIVAEVHAGPARDVPCSTRSATTPWEPDPNCHLSETEATDGSLTAYLIANLFESRIPVRARRPERTVKRPRRLVWLLELAAPPPVPRSNRR